MPAAVRTWPSFANRHVGDLPAAREDDHVQGIQQSLAYYVALQRAGVSTEWHLYAHGGHALGLRSTKLSIGRWPARGAAVVAHHRRARR